MCLFLYHNIFCLLSVVTLGSWHISSSFQMRGSRVRCRWPMRIRNYLSIPSEGKFVRGKNPKIWDSPCSWQLATHRIRRNTFHLFLRFHLRFCLRFRLPLHSQDSLKQEFFHDESHVLIFISHVVGHRGHSP